MGLLARARGWAVNEHVLGAHIREVPDKSEVKGGAREMEGCPYKRMVPVYKGSAHIKGWCPDHKT